jgi:hypothetical protein
MVLADPSGIGAKDALHLLALVFAFPLIDRPSRLAVFSTASGFLPVFFTMASRSDVLASCIS